MLRAGVQPTYPGKHVKLEWRVGMGNEEQKILNISYEGGSVDEGD